MTEEVTYHVPLLGHAPRKVLLTADEVYEAQVKGISLEEAARRKFEKEKP